MTRNRNLLSVSDKDAGLPKDATILAEAPSTTNDAEDGEGSVGYRIAAMVAMFLLALVAIVIWYYGR
jgi:hypothetical protein